MKTGYGEVAIYVIFAFPPVRCRSFFMRASFCVLVVRVAMLIDAGLVGFNLFSVIPFRLLNCFVCLVGCV